MKPSTDFLLNPTRSTPQSRRDLKRLLSDLKTGRLRVLNCTEGFRVLTTISPFNAYKSSPFKTEESAMCHIFLRAAHTGYDMAKFKNLSARYYRRFLS